jgi:hypothetical protein
LKRGITALLLWADRYKAVKIVSAPRMELAMAAMIHIVAGMAMVLACGNR